MLVGEGELFSITEQLSTAGLAGATSASVIWGDGTVTPATVGNQTPNGSVRIRFDYSLDTNNFFAQPIRRQLLEAAADSLAERLGDQLAAITPAGKAQWLPGVFHPSVGTSNRLEGTLVDVTPNLQIASNEIVVFVGARDLPGDSKGVGGTGSHSFPAASNLTQAELQQIIQFRETVTGRGQPGALTNPRTDEAPWGGSIGFDTQTNWYFGFDETNIGTNQVDFFSIATHELAHVLGFGINRTDVVTAWDRLATPTAFLGAQARAAYAGNGNVPLEFDHWADSVLDVHGQASSMAERFLLGKRQIFTPLDFAALGDLGWQVVPMNTTVTASHRYPDNGSYPVNIVLRGSQIGEIVHPLDNAVVTNVTPTLTTAGTQSVVAGQTISVTNIGSIIDSGFRNQAADPPTDETFTFTINWGDGSNIENGQATIDRHGSGNGTTTLASFDGSHVYQTPGNYTATVGVTDDDGAATSAAVTIIVTSPPTLSLELADNRIDENEGDGATTLTVRRSGPATGVDQTVQLFSSDISEARLPAAVVIPANATSASVPVEAIDDTILDGDISVELSASGNGLIPAAVDLVVSDFESLSASFSAAFIREDAADGSVTLQLTRSNSDNASSLEVDVIGNDHAAIGLPNRITIPAGQSSVTVPLIVSDDSDPEATQRLTFGFTATNYRDAAASIDLRDDEPPLFQNPRDRFDVNNDGAVRASDALRVINELARNGARILDPSVESPNGVFYDVSGDYRVTSLDALQVINELGRLAEGELAEGELQSPPAEPDAWVFAPPLASEVIDGQGREEDDLGTVEFILF